jgi:hypothetical protein
MSKWAGGMLRGYIVKGFAMNDGLLKRAGGSTLGAYCVSVTASHYDWAMKKIKAHIKTLNQ